MPTACILAEAKLGPKILCTDPVKHYKNPHFDQELAWALDRRSLRLFRLYRRSIRLKFYTLHGNKCSRKKDPLGYIVLDPREATQRKMYRWRQLLDNKERLHPMVCCGLYIESYLN
ncbi:Centrosomal protein [Echinococcus granulosus]|uniref:Centrosomal protein n=1 Tax=Echinococcus granulosus TaxID=6210 RepID=W6UVX4_ECHGR|nr:Centrosomal protein [Echinococcus granulosus]EUB62572.1 Centrosomal protein [Echinococcus granulosus]